MCSIGHGGHQSSGQMPERSSGTQGSHVNMESAGVCDCLSSCVCVCVFLRKK